MDAHYITLSASIDRMNRTPNVAFTRAAAESAHARAAARVAKPQRPSLMDRLLSGLRPSQPQVVPVHA
jgi:hypothetical protein